MTAVTVTDRSVLATPCATWPHCAGSSAANQ